MINQIEALADRLSKRSIFRCVSAYNICGMRDYNIFMGVPVHCLSVKNSKVNMEQDFPHHVIDLLICRGKEAILAIVFDAEYSSMEELFSTHLQAVPCEFQKSEELTEDAMNDFCGDIEFRIRCDRSDPLHTGCMLYNIRVQNAIFRMNEPAITEKMQKGYRQLLEEKHLIQSNGSVTGYGHACGMFQHRLVDSKRGIYVTVPQAIDKLKRAMLWRDKAGEDSALANRIARLQQGLPSASSKQQAAILENLLQAPLEALFHKFPEDGHRLNALLSHAQFLSRESDISAFGDREDIETYGDVIYAVRNLWEYTAHRSRRNPDVVGTCEQILANLSFPLWSQPTDNAWKENNPNRASGKKRNLQVQLDQLHSEVFDFSLGIMPLQHYFYAAACLTESEYPLWLYRNCVKPMLEFYGSTDLCFAQSMQAIYDLSQSDDALKASDYFPLLYDVLVESVCGVV